MAQCISPFTVKDKTGASVPVPCGKCWNCFQTRVSQWSNRIMYSTKYASSHYFVTLTYNNNNLPFTKNGYKNLDKTHLQKYIKRLRRENERLGNNQKIIYYAVGEYGGKTERPHYHLIILNSMVEPIQSCWSDWVDKKKVKNNTGDIYLGTVTPASSAYCLKYMSKLWKPKHKNDDRQKPFALMSKGIGYEYVEKMKNWHQADKEGRFYTPIEGNKKIALSRYYKNKIYTDVDRIWIGKKLQQKREQEERPLTQIELRNKIEADKFSYYKLSRANKSDKL